MNAGLAFSMISSLIEERSDFAKRCDVDQRLKESVLDGSAQIGDIEYAIARLQEGESGRASRFFLDAAARCLYAAELCLEPTKETTDV